MKSLSASGLASGTSGGAGSTVSACAAIGGEGRRRSECQVGDCDGASIEELKALVMTHLERLAPVLGLQALRAPADAITNGDMWGAGAGNSTGADRLILAQFPIFPLALIGTGMERGTVLKRH
jgi:hypothetical protein